MSLDPFVMFFTDLHFLVLVLILNDCFMVILNNRLMVLRLFLSYLLLYMNFLLFLGDW